MPTEALVQLQGETVVFRRNAAGALEPVPVRIGEAFGGPTMIREGVKGVSNSLGCGKIDCIFLQSTNAR